MKSNSKKIRELKTSEVFNSCREADRRYGWKNGTAWHIAAKHTDDEMSNVAALHGHDFVFIQDDPVEAPVFDLELIEWIYANSHSSNSIRCVETGQVFNSRIEADRHFGFCKGTVSRIMRGKLYSTYHFEAVHTESATLPCADDDEVFKTIPDFLQYSISNFGRVRQNRTMHIKSITRRKCGGSGLSFTVMLNDNSQPIAKSVRELFLSAWRGKPLSFRPSNTSTSKSVMCVSDNMNFNSIRECTNYYNFDYQRFREAMHSVDSKIFTYKGKDFKIA